MERSSGRCWVRPWMSHEPAAPALVPGSARSLSARTRGSESPEQGRSKAGSQTSVSTVTHEQTRGGGVVAGRAAEAQLSELHTRLLPLPCSRCVRSTRVLPPLEAVWLRVCPGPLACPGPRVSGDTCVWVYLPGSVTQPGAMLLSQSAGGGLGQEGAGRRWRRRAEPCLAAGSQGPVVNRGDWQEGDRTLQQSLQE